MLRILELCGLVVFRFLMGTGLTLYMWTLIVIGIIKESLKYIIAVLIVLIIFSVLTYLMFRSWP
jgi:hypothetical protein